jgi:hypothetical protein
MQFRSQEITNNASRDPSAGNDNADRRMQIIPGVWQDKDNIRVMSVVVIQVSHVLVSGINFFTGLC